MKQHPESTIIYNKMLQHSGLNEEAFKALGITKDKINIAYNQCLDAGLSRKSAMKTIYKMWKFSEPKDDIDTNDDMATK